jgi:hypothetical protein
VHLPHPAGQVQRDICTPHLWGRRQFDMGNKNPATSMGISFPVGPRVWSLGTGLAADQPQAVFTPTTEPPLAMPM